MHKLATEFIQSFNSDDANSQSVEKKAPEASVDIISACGDSGLMWAEHLTAFLSKEWINFDGLGVGAWTSLNKDALEEILHVWFANAIVTGQDIVTNRQHAVVNAQLETINNLKNEIHALKAQLEQLQKANSFTITVPPTYSKTMTASAGIHTSSFMINYDYGVPYTPWTPKNVDAAESLSNRIFDAYNNHTHSIPSFVPPENFLPEYGTTIEQDIKCYENTAAAEDLAKAIDADILKQLNKDIDAYIGAMVNGKPVTKYNGAVVENPYSDKKGMITRDWVFKPENRHVYPIENKEQWPHSCPKCYKKHSAYIGLNNVECMHGCYK